MRQVMDFDPRFSRNADQLEQSLARQHALMGETVDDDERSRRADAMVRIGNYVGMLREAELPSITGSFSFKLELQDGRWDVEEKSMPTPPRVGDVVSLHGSRWRVLASQFVRPRPAGRPAREVFVCAPFA
jgi:hypothetical protein